jgi:tetratricopeptide (TPR) repeat protein
LRTKTSPTSFSGLGQFDLALEAADAAAEIRGLPVDDPAMRRVLAVRGETHLGLGRFDEAEAELRNALALAATPIERAPHAFALARVLWARGHRRTEARHLARAARDDFASGGPTVAAMLREVETWLDTRAAPR